MSGLPLIPPLPIAQARIDAMPSLVQSVEVVDNSSMAWIFALALATIALAVVTCLVLQFTKRRRRNDTWHLFNELCHANQLSRSQSRALRKLSKQAQIANPSRLFLEADLWSLVFADSMPVDSKSDQANQLADSKTQEKLNKLREHLFTPGRNEPIAG